MKAFISSNGELQLERAGNWIKQYCPFQRDCFCGEWCPLFEIQIGPSTAVFIKLCQKTYELHKNDFKRQA